MIHARFLQIGEWIQVDGVDREVADVILWPRTERVAVNYRTDSGHLDVVGFDYHEQVQVFSH